MNYGYINTQGLHYYDYVNLLSRAIDYFMIAFVFLLSCVVPRVNNYSYYSFLAQFLMSLLQIYPKTLPEV